MGIVRKVRNFFTSKAVLPEVLDTYRHRIPERILVQVAFDDQAKRWVAKIELPNTKDYLCTESDTQDDLTDMVNDAVMTYYDVPTTYVSHLAHFQNPLASKQNKHEWKLA